MRKLRISVKQLNMFGVREQLAIGGCPRQWGFTYLNKLEKGFLSPQLVDGIKFHACVESLHRDGRMPLPRTLQPGVELTPEDVRPEGQFGRMARASLVHIPRRGTANHGDPLETWVHEYVGFFDWTTSNGVEVEIDLRPDLMSVPEAGVMAYLVDFKSTGSKKHALTGDAGKKPLRDDVQANVYSHGLHLLGANGTLARWIYVDRNTFASWPVERLFTPEKTAAWMHENIDATIELIHTFRTGGVSAMQLPGDENACGGTGHFCDFPQHCLGPVGAAPSRLITLDEIHQYQGKTS